MKLDGRDRVDAWLARQDVEQPIDPMIEIIDPHHHAWNRGGHRYLADEFRDDLDCGHNFVATCYVECRNEYHAGSPAHLSPIGETEFVAHLFKEPIKTRQSDVRAAAAILAYADLSMGEKVEEVIEAHRDVSERLRGIRYPVAWSSTGAIRSHYETGPAMLESTSVRSAIRLLGKLGLVFEAWAYFDQLYEVEEAARACGETTFVINHCGGPIGIGPFVDKRLEVFQAWQKAIARLARCENVVMKMGGLGMPLAGFAFHKNEVAPTSAELCHHWQPYFMACIDAFGPGRCMFESNWPVDRTAGRYGTVWNSFKRASAGFSEEEKKSLFSRTASKTYEIALPG